MQKTITPKQIEHIIKEKDSILERLKILKERLILEIEDEENIIQTVAVKKPRINYLNDNVRKNTYSDLYDTIEKYRTVADSINSDIVHQLNEIIDEKETISRVWNCFFAIRSSGKYYDVLYDNLVNNISIDTLAAKYDRTPGSIFSWKKKALNMIAEIYAREDMTDDMLKRIKTK